MLVKQILMLIVVWTTFLTSLLCVFLLFFLRLMESFVSYKSGDKKRGKNRIVNTINGIYVGVGIRGLCRIAKNGLDIELFDGNIKHCWYRKCRTNQIKNATNAKDSISRKKKRRNTHNRDVRKVVHTTINIRICLVTRLAACGAGIAYTSEAPELTPGF
jgi:hypothetical protein